MLGAGRGRAEAGHSRGAARFFISDFLAIRTEKFLTVTTCAIAPGLIEPSATHQLGAFAH